MGSKRLWALAVILPLAAIGDAAAVLTTNNWTNSVSGKWEDASKWSAGAPDTTDAVNVITNAPTKFITMDALSVGNETISNLLIRGPTGTLNTLRITNALPILIIRNNLTLSTGGAIL